MKDILSVTASSEIEINCAISLSVAREYPLNMDTDGVVCERRKEAKERYDFVRTTQSDCGLVL